MYARKKEKLARKKRNYRKDNRAHVRAVENAWRAKNRDKLAERERKRKRAITPEQHKLNNAKFRLRRIIENGKTSKSKRNGPGFLYFFKSITPGYYKVGCTKRWKQREATYKGPSAIKRIYFVRPVSSMYYAESCFKVFLNEHGYSTESKTLHGDWFVLEEEKVF